MPSTSKTLAQSCSHPTTPHARAINCSCFETPSHHDISSLRDELARTKAYLEEYQIQYAAVILHYRDTREKLNARETEQRNLLAERTDLHAQLAQLVAERNTLRAERAPLEKERDNLLAKWPEITPDFVQAVEDCERYRRERDEATKECERYRMGRDVALEDLERYRRERDELRIWRFRLRVEASKEKWTKEKWRKEVGPSDEPFRCDMGGKGRNLDAETLLHRYPNDPSISSPGRCQDIRGNTPPKTPPSKTQFHIQPTPRFYQHPTVSLRSGSPCSKPEEDKLSSHRRSSEGTDELDMLYTPGWQRDFVGASRQAKAEELLREADLDILTISSEAGMAG